MSDETVPSDENKPLDAPNGASAAEPEIPPRPSMIPPQLAERLPPELRHSVEATMSFMSGSFNPMAAQVTGEHIHKVLDQAERDSSRAYQHRTEVLRDQKHGRICAYVGGAAIFVLLVGARIFIPKDKLDSFNEVAKAAGFLVAGGFGGFGVAMKRMSGDD